MTLCNVAVLSLLLASDAFVLHSPTARHATTARLLTPAPLTARRNSKLSNATEAVYEKDDSFDPFLLNDLKHQLIELRQEEGSMDAQLFPTAAKEASPTDAAVNKARLLLLVAAALYGTNFSCVKMLGQTELPVGATSTLRFGLAALATLPFLLPSPAALARGWKDPQVAAAVAGLEVGMWNSLGYIAQAVGLETTLASKSAFLCSLAVVTVPMLDALTGKMMLPRQIIGVLLALGGVAILELGGLTDLHLSSGDVASLVQPLAFGMGFWRMEAAMHRYPNQAMRSTAGQLMAIAIASAIYCSVTEPGALSMEHVQHWLSDPTIVMGLVWTGVITTALTVYMETVALETLSAAETTLIFSTEPLWGTAFAAAVMGEQLGVDDGLGALLIVSGCLFSNLGLDGIKKLFNKRATQPKQVKNAASTATQLAFFHSGVAAGIASLTSSAWNNLSVAGKVAVMELQDFVEDLLP